DEACRRLIAAAASVTTSRSIAALPRLGGQEPSRGVDNGAASAVGAAHPRVPGAGAIRLSRPASQAGPPIRLVSPAPALLPARVRRDRCSLISHTPVTRRGRGSVDRN